MRDRVFAVTGTSRGIGAAIAARLIGCGARVVGMSRSVASPSMPTGERYTHVEGDVCAAPPERLLDAALDAYGRADGLVNNAGIEHYADCWKQTDDELDETLAVNLTAPFLLSQSFARHWKDASQAGVIVNICSVLSEVGWPGPGLSAYAVSKGGLVGLTRAMALELGNDGIRVVGIAPGIIRTEMAPPEQGFGARIPLGGVAGMPRDIANVVAFALSDGARYVTGEIVYVDGGYLLP